MGMISEIGRFLKLEIFGALSISYGRSFHNLGALYEKLLLKWTFDLWVEAQ